ncbi:Dihydroflavonol-4-reductase [Labilithrix luteola]|uniref:Dihydroflavonol-4-reductase n=2 Tax=Labilithrix luteola TaxID=1391654 RepID=A0A0K1PQL7_9BACT|nr:Dihydroflavonol-4-reductase [Labilithrix luteola]
MRALVIGGTGFVGLNIVDALLEAGATVTVTRRKQSVTVLVRKRPVNLVDASLEEPEKLKRAMSDCDVVYLAGAYYPRYSINLQASLELGVQGVANVCAAARAASVPRLVYTSTIATLASSPDYRFADERDVLPSMPTDSVYRAVKWAMEQEVESARRAGLDAVTLLPGGCIGPGDLRLGTGSVIAGVVRGLLPWWVDGRVNIVDVGDVARAHVAAGSKTPGTRYAIAGHSLRVLELLQTIARRYGGTVPDLELSADEARARALVDELAAAPQKGRVPIPREFVDMAVHGQRVSNARVEMELGLSLTPLEQALDRAHAWLSRFGFVPRPASKEAMNEHV